MIDSKDPRIEELFKKHGAKIEQKINSFDSSEDPSSNFSREYSKFKQEMAPEFTSYERWCNGLGSVFHINLSEKDEKRIKRQIEIAHLEIEPWQVLGLSFTAFLIVFFFGFLFSVSSALIQQGNFLDKFPFSLFFLIVLFALFLFYFLSNYPSRLANKWRLKASSQMVPAILYVVVYMRHTPNLERAVAFASQNLQAPLSLDFRKVFYDVQVGKFSSMKESLDNYLGTWRNYAPFFVESFQLIESSLFEPENSRRIITLEKALQVVLDGVHDKMLKFVQEVKSPLQNTYMFTVVLPVLGIALLPMASAMLGGAVNWVHVFVLYVLIFPFLAFYLTDKIMVLRPGGHGEASLLEKNPFYAQYKSSEHYAKAFLICLPLIIIGLLPLILQYAPLTDSLGLKSDYSFSELGLEGFLGEGKLFDFKDLEGGGKNGPFGVGALFLSLFIPVGIALFFSIAYKGKTRGLIEEREKTKELEVEFNNSLFQLGNRIGNGVPPEIVFGKIAESSKGLVTEEFFKLVNYNIMQMGMSVEKAIFDPKTGALLHYPSNLIATSMKILVESSRKGLGIAAVSLISISEYVRNIQKITSRLKDILAEVVSEMKSNMTFLAPLLSGVVVGLAAMISTILTKLGETTSGAEADIAGMGSLGIDTFFKVTDMIPPYFLQISIGIYLIEIIFILTTALVTVDSGEDKLERTSKIGKNLFGGITFYFFASLMAIISLFLLSTFVLGGLAS
ncbi:MAG: hypothetical protein ABIH28_02895 [archaeon]